jgi:HK97 family phage major capsid protein
MTSPRTWRDFSDAELGPELAALRSQRSDLLARANRILARATAESRDLTSEEARESDALLDEAAALAYKLGSASMREPQRRAGEAHARLEQGKAIGPESRESTIGDEFRALKPDEPFTGELRRLGELSERADPPLSIGRYIRAVVSGSWKGAEAERRALAGSNDIKGGYLVPTQLSAQVIDLARARSVCIAAGAVTVPMLTDSLSMAKLVADPVPQWRGEGSIVASSDPTFGAIRMSAKSLGVIVPVSRELMMDAPNAPAVIDAALTAALGLELDRACLVGIGGPIQPLGIINDNDVQTFNAGAFADWSDLADAVGRLLTQNERGPFAAVMHPRTFSTCDRLVDSTGQPMQKPDSVRGLRFLVTTSLPTNLGAGANEAPVIVGDFGQLAIGVRQNLEIEISRDGQDSTGRGFQRNEVLIRATLRADVALLRPKAFVWLSGVTN